MKRLWLAAGLIGIWWLWRGGSDAPGDSHGETQAAVLRDGFALRLGDRVVVLDRKGQTRTEHRLTHTGDSRVVGTRGGPAAGLHDQRTVRLVDLVRDRTLGVWGKSVRRLCEGVASNDERFAVGWLESDDTIWFVHGDTGVAAAELTEPVQLAVAAPKQWCGIASAGPDIALFWRDRNRLLINTCTRKKCSSLPARVGLDEDATLLGFGCVKNGCLIAARERNGSARFGYIAESGGVKWTKPLPAVRGASIVGVGDRAFALGYATEAGAEVLRVERDGKTSRVWHSERSDVPALAWSRDQLLVGSHDRPTVVALPR